MKRALLVFVAVAAVIAGLLAGCRRQREPVSERIAPPPKMGPQQPRQEPIEVSFTYSEKTCYAPVIVAVEKGFYADEGLKIAKKVVTGGIESAEALITGQADVGVLGDAPSIIVLSRSPKVRIVLCQGGAERMHRIVVHDDSGIERPKDLDGKRAAVQLGSSTHFGFLLYCKEHGVAPETIDFVSLSPRDFPEAMSAAQVDAIAGSHPWPQNVLKQCSKSHLLAVLDGLGTTYPLMILARGELIQESPEAVEAVVRGTQTAVEFIRDNPEQTAELIAKRSGLPPEDEARMLKDYTFGAHLKPSVIDSLEMTAQFLKDQGKIQEIPDLEKVTHRKALEAVGAAQRAGDATAPRSTRE